MPFFSSSSKSEDSTSKKPSSAASTKSGLFTSLFGGSSADRPAAAPVVSPNSSSRPAITPAEAPQGKGMLHAISSNASKAWRGQKMAHSGDSLPDALKSAGRSMGLVETADETAARRAKQARNAHLGQIRQAGAESSERQAGLQHDPSSALSDETKQQFVRDQHLAQIRKAGSASTEHQAGMDHSASTPIAGVTKKEYLRTHPKVNPGLHGGDKLDDIYSRTRNQEGSSDLGNLGVAMQHAGEEGYDAVKSTAGSAVSSVVAKTTGHNVQELAAHGMNASRIVGGTLAARDPGKNLRAAMAGAEHGKRMDQWHGDVEEMRALKESGTADPEALRKARRKALFGAMKAATTNQKAVAARLAVHKDVAKQWDAKDTVGEDASRFGYAPGSEIKASDRDNGTLAERVRQGGASTLSAARGGSSKAFDTTKLTDDEQKAVAKTKETTAGLREQRDKRNQERKANPEAQESVLGKVKRFFTTGSTTKLTSEEQGKITSSRDSAKQIHAEAKARRESPDRQPVSLLQGIKNFGASLIPGSSRKLGDWRGLTKENQAKVDSHKKANAEIAAGAAADGRKGLLWGHRFTAEEKLRRKQNDSAIAKVTAEQSTGYTAKNLDDLAKSRVTRADVKSVARGGFTADEKSQMAAARKERADIKTHAREHAAFAKSHDGTTVGALGRVGGMNTSGTATEADKKSTLTGRIAQGVRGAGRWIRRAGKIFGGSSADAHQMIKDHDMTGAALTTATGIAGEVGAAVATATSGTGTVVKHTQKGVSGVLSGTGEAIEALADSHAGKEDRRNHLADYESGDRFNDAKHRGVDIRPTFEGQKQAPASLVGGIKTALQSGKQLASETEGGRNALASAQSKATSMVGIPSEE